MEEERRSNTDHRFTFSVASYVDVLSSLIREGDEDAEKSFDVLQACFQCMKVAGENSDNQVHSRRATYPLGGPRF